MDEFSSLGNLQSFAATLSYIAGYGMKVFLINQGLPQINGIVAPHAGAWIEIKETGFVVGRNPCRAPRGRVD